MAWLAIALAVAQLLLVLLSWLLSAMMVSGVHSLLSGEGLRYMAAQATRSLLSPLLAWLLMGAMAWGCLSKSGLLHALAYRHSYRHRVAFRSSLVVLVVLVAVVLLLTVPSHAVLLSATGSLWPSPFSQALVPIVALVVVLVSVCYGWLSRTFDSVVSVFHALTWGIARSASLLLLYVLIAQLVGLVQFVF